MNRRHPPLAVKVWGEYACFTRPETKVERVSYPILTPSAARGLLESIFWKPEFTWQIEEIWLLKPIHYFSILRNEVNSKASDRSVANWQKSGGGFIASEDRAQRHTLSLRDVAYVIQANVVLRDHADADEAKYRDQFRRRVQSGRCYSRPYLGCREFAAEFGEVPADERPVDLTDDLGLMLHDLTYATDGSGRGTPVFFQAQIEQGVLRVPRLEGNHVTAKVG
jgi:CRISPR-associated protein Cas5d